MEPGIDLHTHTTASDGSLSPTQLVEAAAAANLSAIAITDHDTVAGLAEGIAAAAQAGLPIISGVELSVEDVAGRFHLLGYGFDPDDAAIAETLVLLRERRATRNRVIMRKAADLALPITWDDVLRHAGDGGEVIGRPHFAAALVEKGAATSIQDAFDRYLASGRPLYTPKDGLTPMAAADLLHAAGGIAVMAHPVLTRWSEPSALRDRLRALREQAGLDGVEAYYSQNTPELTDAYIALARELGFVVTGGSDFHGTPKPHVTLGVVDRGRPAPASLLDRLPAPVGSR